MTHIPTGGGRIIDAKIVGEIAEQVSFAVLFRRSIFQVSLAQGSYKHAFCGRIIDAKIVGEIAEQASFAVLFCIILPYLPIA